jgi:hypothetical protein
MTPMTDKRVTGRVASFLVVLFHRGNSAPSPVGHFAIPKPPANLAGG